MRNNIDVEFSFIYVHITHYVLNCNSDRLLDFLQVLNLLKLIVRELELGCAQQIFIAEQFLPLFLRDDLFWSLLCCVQPQRSWVKSKGVKELLSPVSGIQIQLESLLGLTLSFVMCLFFANFPFFSLRITLLFFFDHRVDLTPFIIRLVQVRISKLILLDNLLFTAQFPTNLLLRLSSVWA